MILIPLYRVLLRNIALLASTSDNLRYFSENRPRQNIYEYVQRIMLRYIVLFEASS